jgi:hypothetical protein
VGFVVNKLVLDHVFSGYFRLSWQFSIHKLLYVVACRAVAMQRLRTG